LHVDYKCETANASLMPLTALVESYQGGACRWDVIQPPFYVGTWEQLDPLNFGFAAKYCNT